MRLLKRTYALRAKTVERFETRVALDNRNAVMDELLSDWLNRQEKERLRREIVEGCREMAGVYLQTELEFHPLEEEVVRGLDHQAKSRRRGAGSARSRRGV